MSDQENQGYKVVDKRRFSESGESLGLASLEGATSLSSQELSPTESAPELNSEEQLGILPQEELNFSSFLFGMYTQTLIYLGDIPHPETNQLATNLDAAKQNIDIMGILEDKTKGNLLNDESKLFEEILNTLRLQYVKNIKK